MKKKKKLVIQRSCIPGKWEKERNQIKRTLLLRRVPNLFFHHRDNIDFQLQYDCTSCKTFGEIICITRPDTAFFWLV